MNEDEYYLHEAKQRREDKAASYDKRPKMRYGKIMTLKIIFNNESDGKIVIDSIKNHANSVAISNRCEISYVTVEPCVDVVE